MKQKVIKVLLVASLTTTSIGWVLSNEHRRELELMIEEKTTTINEKSNEIVHLESVIVDKGAELEEKEGIILKKEEELKAKSEKIEYLQAQKRNVNQQLNRERETRQQLERQLNLKNERGRGGANTPTAANTNNTTPVAAPTSASTVQRTMRMVATAYTIGYESTGKREGHPAFGITASGHSVKDSIYVYGMRVIASDPRTLPMFSIVEIEGFSGRFIALDRGGAIRGNKIDILFDSVSDAIQFGRRNVQVTVIREGRG